MKKTRFGKLAPKQVEQLMWYFKDGARKNDDLSMGNWEVLLEIKDYNMDKMERDIDMTLLYFKNNGY